MMGIGLIAALVGYAFVQVAHGGDGRARELSVRSAPARAIGTGSRASSTDVAAPSTEGAVAVASLFLQLLDDASISADAQLRELTVPPLTAQALRGEAAATSFKRRFGSRAFIHGWPLGWRVVSSRPAAATIAVWTVGFVAGAQLMAPPYWSTTTCELRVIDGRWRVVGANTAPGPTPPPATTDLAAGAQFAQAANRFHVFGYAP
jgi:hypothetical protein